LAKTLEDRLSSGDLATTLWHRTKTGNAAGHKLLHICRRLDEDRGHFFLKCKEVKLRSLEGTESGGREV